MKSIDFVCNQSVFWPLIFNTLLVFVLSPARSWIKILWSWAGCIFAGISILIPPYSNIPWGCWVGGNSRRLLVFINIFQVRLLSGRFSKVVNQLVSSVVSEQVNSVEFFFSLLTLQLTFTEFLQKETLHLLIQVLIIWRKKCNSLLLEVLNSLPDLHLSITDILFFANSFCWTCFEFLTNTNPIDPVFLVFALFMLFAFAPE